MATESKNLLAERIIISIRVTKLQNETFLPRAKNNHDTASYASYAVLSMRCWKLEEREDSIDCICSFVTAQKNASIVYQVTSQECFSFICQRLLETARVVNSRSVNFF